MATWHKQVVRFSFSFSPRWFLSSSGNALWLFKQLSERNQITSLRDTQDIYLTALKKGVSLLHKATSSCKQYIWAFPQFVSKKPASPRNLILPPNSFQHSFALLSKSSFLSFFICPLLSSAPCVDCIVSDHNLLLLYRPEPTITVCLFDPHLQTTDWDTGWSHCCGHICMIVWICHVLSSMHSYVAIQE